MPTKGHRNLGLRLNTLDGITHPGARGTVRPATPHPRPLGAGIWASA